MHASLILVPESMVGQDLSADKVARMQVFFFFLIKSVEAAPVCPLQCGFSQVENLLHLLNKPEEIFKFTHH